LKILTDLRIDQSLLWGEKTDFIDDIGSPGRLSRLVKPFVNALVILGHRRRYDVVILGNIKTAQIVALFIRFMPLRRLRLIVLEVMLDEESRSIWWRFKRSLQRFLFSSIDVIFVSARREIETYSRRFDLPESRFRFLHFHTNITEPRMIRRPEGYLLSAGRTGRDFQTLAEAVRGLPVEVVLISDQQSIDGVSIPENTRLLINIPRREYLELIENSRFVVVPLHRRVKSTGQVAILEAMALGKPVIATDTVGTTDYIKHRKTGLLVPPADPVALREAILELIEGPSLQADFASQALDFIKENCTFEKYVKNILSTAEEIAGKKISPPKFVLS